MRKKKTKLSRCGRGCRRPKADEMIEKFSVKFERKRCLPRKVLVAA